MKKYQSAFILVFAVYISVGIASILMFKNQGSRLSHQLEQQASAQKADEPDTLITQELEPVFADDSAADTLEASDSQPQNDVAENNETPNHEALNQEAINNEVLNNEMPDTDGEAATALEDTDMSADETEPTADPEPEAEPDPETETKPAAESAQDPEPEPKTEPEPEAEPEPEKIYYGYTVKSGKTNVRVRKSAERNSSIISLVNGDDTGYLIEEDGDRSKIVLADGAVGYIYNEYITVSEIPKEDVPKEYR